MDFQTLLGMSGGPQQPVAGGYSTMQQGEIPPELQPKPAATSAEVEQRKAGWLAALERVTSDPNLMRAVGMFGANMVQPTAPGQTGLGKFGESYAVGRAAFDAGEYSKRQQEMQEREQTRREASTTSEIESRGATTEQTRARTPGVAAESALATGTLRDRVDAVKIATDRAGLELDKATRDEDVAKVEREMRKRRAEIANLIPDESLRAAEEARIDEIITKAQQARANLANTRATTAGKVVDTAKDQITLDVLQDMPKEELKEFLTKTGKYSTHTSGVSQQATMWGGIYDKLPSNDPRKSGKTREQFQMDRLTEAKSANFATTVKNLVSAMDTAGFSQEEIQQAVRDMSSGQPGPGRPAAGGPAPAGGGTTGWTAVTGTNMEQRTVDGKVHWRVKPAMPDDAPRPAGLK